MTTPTTQREADKRTLTCDALAQMLAGKYVNDYGYRMLLNGEEIGFNLQDLLAIVNMVRAATDQPSVGQVDEQMCSHVWNDFGQLGGRNVVWCSRCDTLAWTGKEPEACVSLSPTAPRNGDLSHIERLSQVTTRPYRPVYQVWTSNMDGDGVWINTDKMDYDSRPENARRIVNTPTAPQAAEGELP